MGERYEEEVIMFNQKRGFEYSRQRPKTSCGRITVGRNAMIIATGRICHTKQELQKTKILWTLTCGLPH